MQREKISLLRAFFAEGHLKLMTLQDNISTIYERNGNLIRSFTSLQMYWTWIQNLGSDNKFSFITVSVHATWLNLPSCNLPKECINRRVDWVFKTEKTDFLTQAILTFKVYCLRTKTGLTLMNYTFCLHSIYVFCIYLRTSSDLCHLQHKLIGFYNRDEKCLQRGTDWVFK